MSDYKDVNRAPSEVREMVRNLIEKWQTGNYDATLEAFLGVTPQGLRAFMLYENIPDIMWTLYPEDWDGWTPTEI